MRTRRTQFGVLALLLLGAAVAGVSQWVDPAQAADHTEAPLAAGDPAADLADLYVWHDPLGGTLVTAVTFGGLDVPMVGQEGTFDADVLYTVHIDRDGDDLPDIDVLARFGPNSEGQWGVRVENLPGTAGPVEGPVNANLAAGGGLQVFAGLREDPFFFDLDGFLTTLQTGALAFDSTRDSFAGLNVTSIVLEMDLDAVTMNGAFPNLQIWATTARK